MLRRDRLPSRPYVIGIDGPSGAGKTRLAGQVANALGGAVVHLEDLYPGWDGLEAVVPRLLTWVLQPVWAGRAARWRRWDWVAGRYAEWHQVAASGVLVVEGVASGARAGASYLDLLVWVEAPEPVRYAAAMARDGVGYRAHWRGWAAAERRHIEREGTRARADVVVSTHGT